jgi:hypothetical protein
MSLEFFLPMELIMFKTSIQPTCKQVHCTGNQFWFTLRSGGFIILLRFSFSLSGIEISMFDPLARPQTLSTSVYVLVKSQYLDSHQLQTQNPLAIRRTISVLLTK